MRRTVLLLGGLGALLVTALWFLFVISPMNGRMGELEQELETAGTQETTLRATLARLREIQEGELTYIAAVGALESMVPPKPDLADFFDQLSVLKQESGILWLSLTPGQPTEIQGQEYREIPVSLTIQGQYFEVLGYLYGVAELDRLVRLSNISIGSQQDEEGFTILNVTLGGSIFTTGDLELPVPAETPGDSAAQEEDEQSDDSDTEAGG